MKAEESYQSPKKLVKSGLSRKTIAVKLFYVELYPKSVFFGWYRSVFLGIYHTNTEGKLGEYFRYQNFGGSLSKN